MRNYIILNGVNSQTISGLLIQNLPPISKPQKRSQLEEIDGRDGDIVTTLGYSAYDKSFDIGLYGDFDINEIISYFDSKGIVTFSNEPDKYYNYQILNQIDFEKLIRYKTATVKMHVQPFKYSTTEEEITESTEVIEGQGTSITLENSDGDVFTAFDLKGNTYQSMVAGESGTNVTGTDIELDDVDATKENYISLLGDSSQTKMRGVNLLGLANYTTNINGVDFTFSSDGSLTLNGTCTSTISTSTLSGPIQYSYQYDTSTDYTFTKYYVSGTASVSYAMLYLQTTRALDFTIGSIYLNNNNYNTTYSDTKTMTSVAGSIAYFNIYISSGSVFNNLVLKFQFEKGRTATEFEEYNGGIATPNTTTPSNITTVTGENIIKIQNKNLFDKENIVENKRLASDGTFINDNYYSTSEFIEVLPSTNYSYSRNNDYGDEGMGGGSAAIVYYDSEKTAILRTMPIMPRSNETVTITSPANAYYARICDYKTLINTMQFERGSMATSYAESQTETYPITLKKKNLFASPPTSTIEHVTFTLNQDGSFDISGTASALANNYIYVDIGDTGLVNGTTYTLSSNQALPSGVSVLCEAYNGTSWLRHVIDPLDSSNQTRTKDINLASATRVRFSLRVASGTSASISSLKIQLEAGSTPTGFQPYSANPIELCKIGDYQDYFYYKYGNWYKKSYIGKTTDTSGSTGITISDMKSNGEFNSYYGGTISGTTITYDSSLPDNNEIYYQLATPTDTQIYDTVLISQLNNLYTADIYSNKTYITSNGPIINMDYNVVSMLPSPTNPSAIKVVTGDNTITVSNSDGTATQSLPVELDDLELCYYNNYREYLYKESDDWYKMSYIGKLEVDTSDITLVSSYTNVAYASIPKPSDASCYGVTTDISVLCNKATYSSGLSSYDSQNAIGYIFTQADANNFYIGFSKDTTLAEMQSLLANTVIYYNLSIETSIQITDATLISELNNVISSNTYEDETIITSTYESGNQPLYLYVSAYDKLDLTITNSGNTISRPVFTVYGVGDIGIYLNGNQLFSIALGDEEYITIDTENLEAYQDTPSNLKNRIVTGDYDNFYLATGDNNITFEGKVNEFQISNYSRWI